MKVSESKTIKDGEHEGIITAIEERPVEKDGERFNYLDIFVLIKPEDVKIRYGCPEYISIDQNGVPTSKLGKFLVDMGIEVKKDEELSLGQIMKQVIEKPVKVTTKNETSERGTFAKIKKIKKA